jgi:HSP20 family molecular chaperone IbpA
MWAEALELLQSAERLQRQFFQVGGAGAARWEPPVDVYQAGEELWIFFAIPGVPADRVEIVMEGTTLIVQGERPLPPAARGAAIHRLEIPYGRFERRIALPAGQYQVLQRVFDDGCLVLGLRKLA